ncbi:MAG: hypothetical protein JO048_08105, partial [Methylobacteriaceae bacterium]|nr:hypothetical protein [Methylobacteriaceae bacterium]
MNRRPTRLLAHEGGSISILFALSITVVMLTVGGSVDLARSYFARQKLSQVATLACQYASRPSVIQYIAPSYSGANGGATYRSMVSDYITRALTSQAVGYTQTNANPFTYTVNGPADVSLSASVPTTFLQLARIDQMGVGANAHCYDNSGAISQTVPDGNSNYVLRESFEVNACSGVCWFAWAPDGSQTFRTTPQNTFPNSPAFTGDHGAQWYVMGYCAEVDAAGIIRPTVADGSFSAELDCDDGHGQKGNSSISTKVYMAAGSYELRYSFIARVVYADYNPVAVCASTAS